MIDAQLDLVQQAAVAVDFDDPRRSAFGNHHAPLAQRLNGMHFHRLAGVAVGRAGIVRPHDFLRRGIDLGNLVGSLRRHDMPIGKHGHIMNAAPRHLPLDLAGAIDDRQLVVPLHEQPVLGVGGICGACGGEQNHGKNENSSAHGSLSLAGCCVMRIGGPCA